MRSTSVRLMLSALFRAVQRNTGLSVTPSHFYFPVPDLQSLQVKDWTACRSCRAFDLRLGEQIQWVQEKLPQYASECAFPEVANGDAHKFHFNNGFFEHIDAEVAYSFVRERKPKRIIEIGGGNTTLTLCAALRKNAEEGSPGELTCIQPNPAPFLKDGLHGMTQLIETGVQQVPLELFRTLQADDILFIDSSHVVSIDNDVLSEILDILPELAPGVLVHFHDIFIPLDYPKKFVMTNLCFWSEQYLLQAFLSFNDQFKVVWASSAMQQYHPEVLRKAFPAWEGSFARMPPELKVFAPTLDEKNVWPCSFWITRSAGGPISR